MVQWLGLHLPTQEMGSVSPVWGAGILHASWPNNQRIEQKQCCNKPNKDFKNEPHQKIKRERERKVRDFRVSATCPLIFYCLSASVVREEKYKEKMLS